MGADQKQLREKKEEGFEEIYILTYQQLYRDVIQAVGREEKAEKILVDFYVRVYEELGDFPNHIDSEEERSSGWSPFSMNFLRFSRTQRPGRYSGEEDIGGEGDHSVF